ncbi:MAG: lactonase family protein, partial [Saprospiraceae bacterium]
PATKSHVHYIGISPNNKHVFVTDLGHNRVYIYTFEQKNGKLKPASPPYLQLPLGSGPRHLAFHPKGNLMYLINEKSSEIMLLQFKNNTLSIIQNITTLPESFNGKNDCADIHISPDGKFLYGSNRGHDSVVMYSIDQKSGILSCIGHQPVFGQTPRNFVIDPSGHFLYVANQNSDNITIFRRDLKLGTLTYTDQQIAVSMPVCLKFLN